MAQTSEQRLRNLLGEAIPVGKTEADTMFTNNQLTDILAYQDVAGDVFAGAYYGWMEKAANYANLVNVNEGNAARNLSDLVSHALRMADRYVGYVTTPSRGRARIGKITRERS